MKPNDFDFGMLIICFVLVTGLGISVLLIVKACGG
mgnify:CR=1 FL=1